MCSKRGVVLVLVLLSLLPLTVEGQPLIQPEDVTYLGSFTLPAEDGAGKFLTYGGKALSVTSDGKRLYVGCHNGQAPAVAVVEVPPLGERARVVTPCTVVPNTSQVTANEKKLGGTLPAGDDLIVSVYNYYDATGATVKSHMAYNTLTGKAGNFIQVGSGGGRVAGYMTLVPPAWQERLGCTALTGQGGISIISRSNYGPGLTCFDPSQVAAGRNIPGVDLFKFPSESQSADTWSGQSLIFNSTAMYGGVVFPAGTSTIGFFQRIGTTRPCYGDTSNCSNTGGSPYKSYHGAPYITQLLLYKAEDAAAVRAGKLQPWQVRPYGRILLPEVGGSIEGGTYDPTSGRFYVTGSYGESPRVHVYKLRELGGGVPPPDPEVPEEPITFTLETSVEVPPTTVVVPGRSIQQELVCTLLAGVVTCKVKE